MPAVSVNVTNYSSPGVGENAIDPGVPPLATGVREQEDILQSIEVPVGGWVTAHQHGFQEGVPLGGRQRTLTTLVSLEGQKTEDAPQYLPGLLGTPKTPAAPRLLRSKAGYQGLIPVET